MKREYLIGTLLSVFAVLIRGYYIWLNVLYYIREGSTAMAAWKTLEGQIMFQDFYYAQTPLWGYLVTVMYALFGVGLAQGRIMTALWSGVLTFVIFYVGTREINLKGGLVGGLIFALHPLALRYGILMLNDFPAMTPVLIGYSLLIGFYENTSLNDNIQFRVGDTFLSFNKKLLIVGVSLGVGVLIKLIVAPILLAFIFILLIEGHNRQIDPKTQAKLIGSLILGFVVIVGIFFTPFLLIAKDAFIYQILGQHLSKMSLSATPWRTRITWLFSRYRFLDINLVLITAIGGLIALKTPYGRGLIIISATLAISVILLVPRPHHNYYDIHMPIIAMICGFFPLTSSEFTDLFDFFKRKFRWFKLSNHLSNIRMKKFRGTPAIIIILQILGLTFMAYYIIDIGLSKPHNIESMSDKALETVRWLQENTAPDEYILSDNTNINIMSERRGPFAEISIDRMDLGRLTSKMLIRSLYDYQIRIVVVTGRQFDTYKALDDFMDFVKENYTKVEAGYRIYVRDSPLSYRIFSRQLSAVLSSVCGPQILAGFN